ncbi:MAG: V4R domain-containing protein [Deltaproteobacteria bacterium]
MPAQFEPPFAAAEGFVEKLFASVDRRPEEGTIRVGGQRYVFMRCESLYLSWFDAMADAFGEETARDFIYNTAREIGRSDAADFSRRMKVESGIERLSAGPVHFAHAGWALVNIAGDSAPSPDGSYYLHYHHPNTFESEVLVRREKKVEKPACLFSAGYSAGWCSDAFNVEVHAREVRCIARGDQTCEFIMAPPERLDGYELRLLREGR